MTTAARDWEQFLALVHPDCEAELRSQPGRIVHGRAEMEQFVRGVIPSRVQHEMVADNVQLLAENVVVALGRLHMTDEHGTRDSQAGWLMQFEDGMLRRSLLVDSLAHAETLLPSVLAGRAPEPAPEAA